MIVKENITKNLEIEYNDKDKIVRFYYNNHDALDQCTIEPFKTNMRKFLRNLK